MADGSVYEMFPEPFHSLLAKTLADPKELQEIRMRAGKPLFLRLGGTEYAVTEDGKLTEEAAAGRSVTRRELEETLEYLSGYSVYAFDEEMKQGFLTVPGGHRIGLAGKVVMEGGRIQCIRHIACLNIRFSHEIPGCADPVMPYLFQDGEFCHTLIVSPPRCGKTTLLRDVIRQLSDGSRWMSGVTVGVVDERSEIAGACQGIPQNDVGMRTDVLDCCQKSEGMRMLLRSMSPQVIAVDEIGNPGDFEALFSVFYCGCRLLATAHGSSMEDIRRRLLFQEMNRAELFERYVVLQGKGRISGIFDAKGRALYQQQGNLHGAGEQLP